MVKEKTSNTAVLRACRSVAAGVRSVFLRLGEAAPRSKKLSLRGSLEHLGTLGLQVPSEKVGQG